MLARSEAKTPLFVLLALTAIACLASVAAVVLSVVGGYIGVTMQRSSDTACWPYLTLKVQSLNVEVYNIIFFACCFSVVVLGVVLVMLVRLLLKLQDSQEQHFRWWGLSTFYLFYVLYSVSLLGLLPGAGYYLTLVIEKGVKCTASFQLHWLTIGSAFVLAILMLLACWVFLFLLKLKYESRYEGKEEERLPGRAEKMPEIVMQHQTMKNMIDLMLMEQRIQDNLAEKQAAKQPLLQEVDSEDKVPSEEGQKMKISYVEFEEYKRKLDLVRKRQEEEEQIIINLMRIEQETRKENERKEQAERQRQIDRKKKLSSLALSPDDKDFDKIFEESEEDAQQTIQMQPVLPNQYQNPLQGRSHSQISIKSPSIAQSKSQQIFYPANYVPVDEQDQRKFKQYKKKLLEKANIKKNKSGRRHLQNIEGGRSKKQLERMINAHKRPHRTIEWYQNMLKNNHTPPIQEIQDSDYTSSQIDRKSATFNFNQLQLPSSQSPQPQPSRSPTPEQREMPSMIESKEIRDMSSYQEYSEPDETPSRLLFEKRLNRSPIRKKLFEEESKYFHNLTMGSVLGTLVKGVVQSTHQTRLIKIREKREGCNPSPHKKDKLIDFIRSRYS